MMTYFRILKWVGVVGAMAALGATTGSARTTKAPDWVTAAAQRPTPDNVGKASAVVLLDEAVVGVESDGTFEYRQRWVMRVLRGDGKDYARASADYVQGAGKVKTLRAWTVGGDGEVIEFGKKELADVAINSGALELYGESHRQVLVGISDHLKVGDIFAYESERMDRTDFAEIHWQFDSVLPVVESSLRVGLPKDWNLNPHFQNLEPFAAEEQGTMRTWRVKNLPGRKDEEWAPNEESQGAAVFVTLDPPANLRRTSRVIGHTTWSELAGFFEPDYDAASKPSPALVAKAKAATAGATTNWERIKALCALAQSVRYISISLNLGHSGGFRPRSAAEVERVGYGDCKDKSTYLRALLRAVDLDGKALLVSSQGRHTIDEAWVSPDQFNHCILAIPVDGSAPEDVPVIEHATLGRLFVFDPTDEYTPPGWLGSADLSRQAFLLSANAGGIVAMPPLLVEQSGRERVVEFSVDRAGATHGRVREEMRGRTAVRSRAIRKDESASDYDKRLVRGLTARLSAPVVEGTIATDHFERNRFELEFGYTGEAYGKTMRDVLLVFQPVVYPYPFPRLKPKERKQPIRLTGDNLTESTTITLPEGFEIDELPEDVELESPFGRYRLVVEANEAEDHLVVKREFALVDGEWPATKAEALSEFIEAIRDAEQTPVVLAKSG